MVGEFQSIFVIIETVVNSEVNRQQFKYHNIVFVSFPLYFIEGVDFIVNTHF